MGVITCRATEVDRRTAARRQPRQYIVAITKVTVSRRGKRRYLAVAKAQDRNSARSATFFFPPFYFALIYLTQLLLITLRGCLSGALAYPIRKGAVVEQPLPLIFLLGK
mgnify:CR=1 FL=1